MKIVLYKDVLDIIYDYYYEIMKFDNLKKLNKDFFTNISVTLYDSGNIYYQIYKQNYTIYFAYINNIDGCFTYYSKYLNYKKIDNNIIKTKCIFNNLLETKQKNLKSNTYYIHYKNQENIQLLKDLKYYI